MCFSRSVTEMLLGCHWHPSGIAVLLAVRLCILGHSEEIPLLLTQSTAEQAVWVTQGSGERQGNALVLVTSGA